MEQQSKNIFICTHQELLAGIDKVLTDYKVAALTNKAGKTLYDYVNTSNDIEFDYQPTILSPKKFFFPQNEVIVEYTADGKVAAKITAEPLVLFGVRPCDLHGIKILDEAFADSHGDPNYLAKREKAVIIGMDCKQVCDEHAFCYRVKSNYAEQGFDLMLHDLGGKYAITVATDKGQQFLQDYFAADQGSQQDLDKFLQEKQQAFADKKPFKYLDKLPEVFATDQDKADAVFEAEGNRCLSCGSCIMVCPTCYCFDVADELKLNLKQGERIRRWDACMLSSFAVVAGGENFRHDKTARLKHRINRKFNYLMKKHGQAVCVGCGRCVRACLAEISPKTIVEKITGEPK